MKKPYYLVAGLGQTGYSVAGYLHRRKLPFAVFDTRSQVDRLTEFSADFPGIDVFLGDFPSALYGQLTQIIASPGLSLEEPFLERIFSSAPRETLTPRATVILLFIHIFLI